MFSQRNTHPQRSFREEIMFFSHEEKRKAAWSERLVQADHWGCKAQNPAMTNQEGREVDETTFKFAFLQKTTEVLKHSKQKGISDTWNHTELKQKKGSTQKSKYCAGNKPSEGAMYKQVRYAAARTAEHRRIVAEEVLRRKTNWPATKERSLEIVKTGEKDKNAKTLFGLSKERLVLFTNTST